MQGGDSDGSEPAKRQAELTAELEKPETCEQSGRAMEINRAFQGVLTALKGKSMFNHPENGCEPQP